MRLIWIRHGETLWNREFRLQGTSDVELSLKGVRQAECLAEHIADRPVKLYTSPLKRTQTFAAPLAQKFALTPVVLDELREMSFGRWEGLRYADMDPQMQHWFEKWCADPVNVCPPEGEAAITMAGRVRIAIEKIRNNTRENDRVAIVTHGGVIRVAVTLLMGMPPETAGRLQIDPGSVTVTDNFAGNWRLAGLNDTCHLRCQDC
jgi:broad specificity phosphatase PhoE